MLGYEAVPPLGRVETVFFHFLPYLHLLTTSTYYEYLLRVPTALNYKPCPSRKSQRSRLSTFEPSSNHSFHTNTQGPRALCPPCHIRCPFLQYHKVIPNKLSSNILVLYASARYWTVLSDSIVYVVVLYLLHRRMLFEVTATTGLSKVSLPSTN